MKPSKQDKIETFIQREGVVQLSHIMKKFSLSKSGAFPYLKKIGALTSFNSRGQFYILPQYHTFDENGLLFFDNVGFYSGGNLLAAICHLVEISPQGLGVRELNQMLRTDTHSQLPALHRNGRLQRESFSNRPGNAYIYFSPDKAVSETQRKARFAPKESAVEVPEVEIAPEELPDVIDVLLTLLAHPDFSAKSVALSLQRRGRNVTSRFANRVFQAFGLPKKKQ